MKVKVCLNCCKSKDVLDFYFSDKAKTKRMGICKSCHNKRRTQDRRNEPTEQRLRRLIKDVERQRRTATNLRAHDIDYNGMFVKQQGCCAICGIHQSALGKALAVDHNHITLKVRGLLCSKCNLGIGNLMTDKGTELLYSAINYINNNQ